MDITTIPAQPGFRKKGKRLGRGIGSGRGKTCARGQKGSGARSGSRKRPGFEGGRTPLIRLVPKRGFIQKATQRPLETQVLNLVQLEQFSASEEVTPQKLKEAGLVETTRRPIKLLGNGELKKKLTVRLHAASASARSKITAAGGQWAVFEGPKRQPGS